VSVHGPPWLHFESLQILNFDFDVDPDPLQNADPNTASQNTDPNPASQNADPDPQPCPNIHTKESKYLEQYFVENKVDQFRALSIKRQNSRDFSRRQSKSTTTHIPLSVYHKVRNVHVTICAKKKAKQCLCTCNSTNVLAEKAHSEKFIEKD
jgi:hypothetical protein